MNIETLNELRPPDIFEIIPLDFFKEDLGEPDHDEYLLCRNYYEYYYALSRYYQPTSLLEIGVRRGYSMAFLMAGSPSIEFVEGWDIPAPSHHNYVRDCLQGLDVSLKENTGLTPEIVLQYKNSQAVQSLDRTYDMIHIDGAHEFLEKIHDLELIIGKSKVVIVDDFKCHIVGGACREFMEKHGSEFEHIYSIDSLRGTLVLEQKI